MYELASSVTERVREMDALKQEGKVLGALHGFPVPVKDCKTAQYRELMLKISWGNIATAQAFGLDTNAGAAVLTGSKLEGTPIIDEVSLAWPRLHVSVKQSLSCV